MNVENLFLFVGLEDQSQVVEHVRESLVGHAPQPEWRLPSSFSTLLQNDKKRKVGVSSVKNGWVQLVESKEVVDFGMAKNLADGFAGKALVLQLSDVTGKFGFLLYSGGSVEDWHFGSESQDILASARALLKKIGVPFDVAMFREVVGRRSDGWQIVAKPAVS